MKTEIFSLQNSKNADLARAAQIIRSGGLVVFPTETVYGLGGDATNPMAAKKIYAAKGRPSDNPLIIHISDPRDAEKYSFTTEMYRKIADKFMPGPITVILKSRDIIPPETRGGLDTVAVRCPENEIARELIYKSGVPIAAPSANLSGSPSPTKLSHVVDDMYGRVDAIIDGGECEIGLESTIVSCDPDGNLTLLRPGKITVDELLEVCPELRIADAVTDKLKDGEIAKSPGMKYKHYAPKASLILLDGGKMSIFNYIKANYNPNIAVICYDDDLDLYLDFMPESNVYPFGKSSDVMTQAKLLFSRLRETDKQEFDTIYAPLPARSGIGLALYNRMIRAAAHTIIKL